jgi:outer membrane protein assembly factor BamB
MYFLEKIKHSLLLCMMITPNAVAQELSEQFRLESPTPQESALLGTSVSIGGGQIAVGAIGDNENNTFSGAVFLFDQATGKFLRKLTPDDAAIGDFFGERLVIDNGVLAISSPRDDDVGPSTGSVYLYDLATGTLLHKLTPNDVNSEAGFGLSLAMDDGILVVGSQFNFIGAPFAGSAYVFDVASGVQLAKLVAQDPRANAQLGNSVAIGPDFIAIGARTDGEIAEQSGAVYLFNRTTWEQHLKLTAYDGGFQHDYGLSVNMIGDFCVVSAPNYYDESNLGKLYAYDARDGSIIWTHTNNTNGNLSANLFGGSMSNDGRHLVVGAPLLRDPALDTPGGAFVFDCANGRLLTNLTPSELADDDGYGSAVSVVGNSVVVGAPRTGQSINNAGIAYTFSLEGLLCEPDLNGDEQLDIQDVEQFLDYYLRSHIFADFESDGQFNYFDVAAFIRSFYQGCD